MKTPYKCECGSTDYYNYDTRTGDLYIKRRKKCKKCGRKLITYEVPAEELEDMSEAYKVVKGLAKFVV